MADTFELFDEPKLTFGGGHNAEDPHDGLSLFGAFGAPMGSVVPMPPHVVIGTRKGLDLWPQWAAAMNASSACVDIGRQRPWPPYPGFDVAFGSAWPKPYKEYEIDANALDLAARKMNRHERSFTVANLYLNVVPHIQKLDARPAVVICIVPDDVHKNCRPKSFVPNPSDEGQNRSLIKAVTLDARRGQRSFLTDPEVFEDAIANPEQYLLSSDFRRQLKARMMVQDLAVQIIRESTLEITDQVRRGEKGTNPLSDRLWNLGTALFYKCGRKPWTLATARDGVCYVGIAYRKTDTNEKSACCAAQMFLDSGDGIVFLGEFGPWYSSDKKEFHLPPEAAERLLRGTLETYAQQDGRPLKEVFLHARSGIDNEEFEGFKRACPKDCRLVGIRVRQDRGGPRLFRDGTRPVLRGTFWQRSRRSGFLFATGFKPRLGTYDGFEIPVPLELTIQHGEADLAGVGRDILALTKLNYNACQLGEAQPITIKYSDAIGEILLANPALREQDRRHNFKYYI